MKPNEWDAITFARSRMRLRGIIVRQQKHPDEDDLLARPMSPRNGRPM